MSNYKFILRQTKSKKWCIETYEIIGWNKKTNPIFELQQRRYFETKDKAEKLLNKLKEIFGGEE